MDAYAGTETNALVWLGNGTNANGEPVILTKNPFVTAQWPHTNMPPGFDLVCNGRGVYAVKSIIGVLPESPTTSPNEAFELAWRIYDQFHNPLHDQEEKIMQEWQSQWHDCEEKGNQ